MEESIWGDLRYFTLRGRRYRTSAGSGKDQWRDVIRRYGNAEKRLQGSSSYWHVIEYKDGHKELAHLRVLQNGLFSGLTPAIYRGLVFPHRIDYVTFSNIERIRLAF